MDWINLVTFFIMIWAVTTIVAISKGWPRAMSFAGLVFLAAGMFAEVLLGGKNQTNSYQIDRSYENLSRSLYNNLENGFRASQAKQDLEIFKLIVDEQSATLATREILAELILTLVENSDLEAETRNEATALLDDITRMAEHGRFENSAVKKQVSNAEAELESLDAKLNDSESELEGIKSKLEQARNSVQAVSSGIALLQFFMILVGTLQVSFGDLIVQRNKGANQC